MLSRLRNRRARAGIPDLLERAFPGQTVARKIPCASSIISRICPRPSTFRPFDEAVVVSVDGFGDFSSAAWGVGSGTEISIDGRVYFPHSLGIFYQALTQYLGFPHYGDEYKVMGLAPYGEPSFLDAMRKIVRLLARRRLRARPQLLPPSPRGDRLSVDGRLPRVRRPVRAGAGGSLLGPRARTRRSARGPASRHRPLGAGDVRGGLLPSFDALAEALRARQICARRRLRDELGRQRQGAADDAVPAGLCAVGGGRCRRRDRRGLCASGTSSAATRSFVMDHAYWGPQFGDADIAQLIAAQQSRSTQPAARSKTIADEAELCRRTAAAIADGKVVGWFQGRMEWGPRALGNRSIVCDPRRADMKAILNAKIKRRESFRPFAPSVLEEAVPDWFEEDDDVPFMMQVFQIREEKRKLDPRGHPCRWLRPTADGSSRTNPRYYRLIESFRDLTGVPMVLNTSFNENEPVVCEPQEALDCFLRTKMDVLVMGNTNYFEAEQ